LCNEGEREKMGKGRRNVLKVKSEKKIEFFYHREDLRIFLHLSFLTVNSGKQ